MRRQTASAGLTLLVLLVLGVVTTQSAQSQTFTVLYNFTAGSGGSHPEADLIRDAASDGWNPVGGVILDAKGNLYGDTEIGGSSSGGVAYKLSKNGTLTVLHSFSASDGEEPGGGLIRDKSGNFYGTTGLGGSGTGCGSYGCGTVWKLTP